MSIGASLLHPSSSRVGPVRRSYYLVVQPVDTELSSPTAAVGPARLALIDEPREDAQRKNARPSTDISAVATLRREVLA